MDASDHNPAGPETGNEAENLNRLRLSRDAAMHAANMAVRDATRLTRLLTAINDSGALDALLERILLTLSELFAAEVVVLLDPAGTGSFVPLSSIGLPEDLAGLAFSGETDGNVARTMRDASPLLIKDATKDPTVDAQLRDLEVGSVIYVPVIASHEPRGVLILARCQDDAFAFADVGLLTAMAYRIGLAVEQAQRRAQLERMVRSEHDIGLNLTANTVARRTVDAFPKLIGADGATIVILDETDGGISRHISTGTPSPSDTDLERLVKHLLAETGLGAYEPHAETVALTGHEDGEGAETLNCAMLAVPMGCGRLQGILIGFRALPTPFDPDLHTIAMLYASQSSAMIENAYLYETVHSELADRRRAELALKASEERLGALIRSVRDLIVVLGPDDTIRFGNPAAAKVFVPHGKGGEWDRFWDHVRPEDVDRLHDVIADLDGKPGETRSCSVCLVQTGIRHEYDVVLNNLGHEPAVGGIVLTFHDITDRVSYEAQLEDQAFRDPLTALANRAHFQDRLQEVLARSSGHGMRVAVIFFDLDDFKIVNDSLGHEAGDIILKTVAMRMRSILRPGDIGARLGGDEFTVLLPSEVSADAARGIARRLLRAIREPISIRGRDVVVGGSFGIALGTPGIDTADDLLRRADVAMYHAKSHGKNDCALFDEALEIAAVQRLEAETELRRALARDELDVFFQPIVSLADGRLCCAEALMRWRHPERGLIAPGEFITVAETTGLIVDAGHYLIDKTFNWLRVWRDTAGVSLPVHINLSPRELAFHGVTGVLIDAARRHGIAPETIVFEITESSLITSESAAIGVIGDLHDHGFHLAIDDFGTGYSSLSYIKKLPVDVLKIDRAFSKSITTDPRDKAIVQAILALSETLDINVVAEGIETEEQRQLLMEMGCGHGQGYLFAPALPGDEFESFLPFLKSGDISRRSRDQGLKPQGTRPSASRLS